MRWIHQPAHAPSVADLARELGVHRVVAELLVRNGVTQPAPGADFLAPRLAAVRDPFALPNLERAADRLIAAVARREEVVILGDYDVDGVSSTALLVDLLRRLGLPPRYVVPRRLEDGYGLTQSAIERALAGGVPRLFIALDCGTNSAAEVAGLRARGADVIILDHHRSKDAVAAEAILVNPHVEGGAHADDAHLCTVGLVFKLAHGVLKKLRAGGGVTAHEIRPRDYLDLVALGTIADLVPLRGENRIYARHGLDVLARTQRPGLQALMAVAGLKPEVGLAPADISYRLGPRINASGRLGDAAIAVDLLLSEDWTFCRRVAQQLEELNRERQDIERLITVQAQDQAGSGPADARGLVLYHEEWHPGVVGIVAGRISRQYNRPAIVLGREGALAKGSGRGLPGYNLVELLGACRDCLENWGGHPMAVGVSLRQERVGEFRALFEAAIRQRHGEADLEPALEISAYLKDSDLGEELMQQLDRLQPFGQGNPEPTFAALGVRLRQLEVFKDVHFRFTVEDARGRRTSGVAWKMAHHLPPTGEPLDLALQLNWNHFNGRKTLQVELLDWRRAAPV